MAIEPQKVAALLLAAGRSERFGGPKLQADLNGAPLGLHAARRVADVPFAQHIAVTGPNAPDYAPLGFHIIATDDLGAPQSHSLALGISALDDVEACLVVLADMPFITRAHIEAMLAAFDGGVLASTAGGAHMPPALFPRATFERLKALTGDQGGRGLFKDARLIAADPASLRDIDTPADLAASRDG